MKRKHFILLSWFLPIILVVVFLIGKFTQLLDGISIRVPAIIIAIISIFLNAILFRPEDGTTKPEGPLPKYQIQRLFHAVLTAVAMFAILKFMP